MSAKQRPPVAAIDDPEGSFSQSAAHHLSRASISFPALDTVPTGSPLRVRSIVAQLARRHGGKAAFAEGRRVTHPRTTDCVASARRIHRQS